MPTHGRGLRGVMVAAAAAVAFGPAHPAAAAPEPIGVWTLSMPGTARQCRVQFRAEAAATGQAISVPPGCRHAFPLLAQVRSWSVPDGVHLALNDEVGASVLLFDEVADGSLEAAGPEGSAAFKLTAVVAARKVAVPASAEPAVPARAEPASPAVVAVPTRAIAAAAVAGHYAVMRGSRDTGCMVTLDDPARGGEATTRARLAPACRDQGIIIFDPVGWSLKAGHLVLAARRGHTASFSSDEGGAWVKDGTGGPPLGLKRL